MAKSNLLKEAIADAKAVRETALANAKIALEEAFTPRIQSMLSAKLAEEEEMEEEMEDDTAVAVEPEVAPEVSEDEHGEEEVSEDMEGEEEVSEEMEGEVEETEEPAMEEDMEEEPVAEEEDLELEAIIKELEEELSDSSIGDGDNKVDQADDHTEDPGEGDLTEEEEMEEGEDKDKMEEEAKEDMDEDISLDEIINALREEEGEKVEEEEEKVEEAEEKELEEAYNVIKFLRSKINEVNLLNAKLLFSNKLFRNHSLNENQKMKVIENFDRAQSLREVKLVFATLAESFVIGGKTKRTIKESYASKPSRSTAPSKKVISEGSDLSARWRKLANL